MKPHQIESRACQLGEDIWEGDGGTSRGRFFSQGHLYQNLEPRGGGGCWWVPEGLKATHWPRISQQQLRKICHTWGSPSFIWASVPGLLTTSSNWLDFSTFVREPAALAQLSICRKGSRELGEKKKKAFKSLFLFISLFSAPPPCSLHCHASSSSSSFFKKSFYNNLFLYVVRALGILPVTCL